MMDRTASYRGTRFSGLTAVLLAIMCFHVAAAAQSGPPQHDMAIDRATRDQVIEGVIADLNRGYVFPEKAAVIEKDLRAQLRSGSFDSVASAEKLADVLTATLRRDSDHDGHLEVRYFEQEVPAAPPNQEDSPAEKAADLLDGQRFNFGFGSIERLRGNIGYIDLHEFPRPSQPLADRIAAAMSFLGDTDALIIDLRHNHGGDPDSVMLFASYLFNQRTHLNDIYYRDENRTEERWTAPAVPGKMYGSARKLYLLTSHETFSGAEDFAYALKYADRATLVGETTGGGAHAGAPHRLSAHFMINVPSGRPINPVTHTDWEGVGVTPDINTSADHALEVAELAALADLIAKEKDPRWKQKLQDRVTQLKPTAPAK